jgi:hypothetical protein
MSHVSGRRQSLALCPNRLHLKRATGVRPELPAHLADLSERPEHTQTLAKDLVTVQKFVRSVSNVR